MMGKWLVAGLCLLLLSAGCSNEQVEQMQQPNEALTDPALDAFENQHLLGVGYAASGQKPNWAEVKKLASADSFKTGLSTFESAPLPSGGDAAKKAAFVAAAKKLPEAPDTEAAYKEMMEAKRVYRN